MLFWQSKVSEKNKVVIDIGRQSLWQHRITRWKWTRSIFVLGPIIFKSDFHHFHRYEAKAIRRFGISEKSFDSTLVRMRLKGSTHRLTLRLVLVQPLDSSVVLKFHFASSGAWTNRLWCVHPCWDSVLNCWWLTLCLVGFSRAVWHDQIRSC